MIGAEFPNGSTDYGNLVGGTVASATVGGVGSVLGGGKFENGAVTGAFGYLFNQAAHEGRQPGVPGPFDILQPGTSTNNGWVSWVQAQVAGIGDSLDGSVASVHGNSADSMRGTEVYYLINRDSLAIDKIGITSDAAGRYSQAYLNVQNVDYVPQTQYSSRYPAVVDENIRLTWYRINNDGNLPRLNQTTR